MGAAKMNPEERPRWPYPSKLVISLLLVGLAIYLLRSFSVVIPPLIIAIIIAFVLSPIAKMLQRRLHLPRILAIILSYIIAILVIALFPSIIIPWLASEFSNLNLDLQRILSTIEGCSRAPVPDRRLRDRHQRAAGPARRRAAGTGRTDRRADAEPGGRLDLFYRLADLHFHRLLLPDQRRPTAQPVGAKPCAPRLSWGLRLAQQ